jgi:hypothetical protein
MGVEVRAGVEQTHSCIYVRRTIRGAWTKLTSGQRSVEVLLKAEHAQKSRVITVDKNVTKPMMGFGSFNTARRTLCRIEVISMICKGLVKRIGRRDNRSQVKFIGQLFGISA